MKRTEPPAALPTNPAHPARKDTDTSLRRERKKTDAALADKRVDVEARADDVMERARVRADEVLETARDKADDRTQTADALSRDALSRDPAIASERALEDLTLKRERAAADETLRRERAALAAHLPIERELTDRFLLTERTRSDDALANRDDFMGMVSHDLRNILSAMGLTATQLSVRASQSAEGHRTIEGMRRIHRYVARMDRLIGDLVDVVSIDSGKLAVSPARRPVTTLVAEAVDSFTLAASEKGVSLRALPVPSDLHAELDAERILQVLGNLIGNAIKFTERGGTVEVGAERVAEAVRLTVSDTGIGIADDKLEAVFKRFWQVERDQRGLGLGLYISKCIVDAHGGTMGVHSVLGGGSAFFFSIPDRRPEIAHTAEQPYA